MLPVILLEALPGALLIIVQGGLDGRLRALKSYEPGRFYARLPYDFEIR